MQQMTTERGSGQTLQLIDARGDLFRGMFLGVEEAVTECERSGAPRSERGLK